MNQCSGNGVCGSNGQCTCSAGWRGADCTLESKTLTDGLKHSTSRTGPKYFSFTNQGGDASRFSIQSDVAMDIYVTGCAHADPNQFQNQLTFKQTKRVTLNSHDFELLDTERGYTVTVYVPAIDENANTLLNNTLSVSYNLRVPRFEDAIDTVVPEIRKSVEKTEEVISNIHKVVTDDLVPQAGDLWSKITGNLFLQN